MTEKKETPKSPDAREPVVMPAAIVTFEENYKPNPSQRGRKIGQILMFMEEEKPKTKEQTRPEFKEPRVMESAIEKIEKARKPDSH